MEVFGKRMREARVEKGMTQEKLAQLMHVSRRTVGGWEVGQNEPSMEQVIELTKILECDVNYLFGVS